MIVGIGASAGGLSALEQLLGRLRTGHMAFVVFQHLAPDHVSMLPEILARRSALPVVSAAHGQLLGADKVYVVPAGVDARVERGALYLAAAAGGAVHRPIDGFLRSLALDQGARAVGVILSGAGSDGARGMRQIKDEGGITFAQDPLTAAHGSMPQAALDTGSVDFCLNPQQIGDELMRLGAHPLVASDREQWETSPDALPRIFRVLRQVFGVDFTNYKQSTIDRRLARRMALVRMERVPDYAALVESDRNELNRLYADLLIGVTSFFRDKEPFDALKASVFPRLVQERSAELPLRVWVAGCATGEEAYSIVICLLEYLTEHALAHKIQVFATDINEDALVRARQGIYPAGIELDVSPERLQRFFTKAERGYQVSRQVRDLIVFANHNLGKDPPFSRIDLVSCRNVLIYLQPPMQKKAMHAFHYALNPDGFLLLGCSESVGDGDLFSLHDRDIKIYMKKNVASAAVFDFTLGARQGSSQAAQRSSAILERRPVLSAQQIADRKIIERYAPAAVLIDANSHVVQFRGQTGRFLAPAAGIASLSILKLVRPELMLALRSAIESAYARDLPVSSESVHVSSGEPFSVVMDVIPLHDLPGRNSALLVAFRDQPDAPHDVAAPGEPHEPDGRLDVLRRELLTNKEYLETIIQELENANQDLQAANEELQSSNEELQSTNEELETSKEELQSSNEELVTVNDELHMRMTQLAVAKDDLVNVLCNLGHPLVLVGPDLRIRRFSQAAERELSLIAGDMGRPVGYLAALLNVPKLEQMVLDTMSAQHPREQNIRGSNGSWYSMRTAPYLTADRTVHGAVIELMGTPALRPSEVVSINELVGKVLSTLPHALMLLDDHLRLVWANRAFFDELQVGAEAIGQPLEQAWPSRAAHPDLWAALESAAYMGKPFTDLVVAQPMGRRHEASLRFSAQCLAAELERPPMTLVVMDQVPAASSRP